jgi:serine O-acetyltransferase
MKRQFQVYSSSTDNNDPEKSAPLQTTDLRELASQIDSKFKSSRGSSAEENHSGTTSPRYQLGLGKNLPVSQKHNVTSVKKMEDLSAAVNWNVPEPAMKKLQRQKYDMGLGRNSPLNAKLGEENNSGRNVMRTTTRLLPKADELSARLTKAVWDEGHFVDDFVSNANSIPLPSTSTLLDESVLATSKGIESAALPNTQKYTITGYQQIDQSIPSSVYSLNSTQPIDLVWDLMREEAHIEAAREPLLVSFLYSTILNHPSLESALSFHLANRLSSPTMLSTQIMSLIREASDADPIFRRNLRADILAVRDRDPACNCLPDVFLYFKGFHALQTYRVANYLWKSGRRVLAHYLQSQVSQHFQIDIRECNLGPVNLTLLQLDRQCLKTQFFSILNVADPNATLGSGIMLDHGTGIVIGETAHLGHNCSVLHHVTLGGSGKKGNDRHPKVGNGVLLGAGASILGNIKIGDGCQVGAGTLVIEDLPPRSVAVGVPAKIIGKFVDVTAQPSIRMNQLGSKEAEEDIFMFGMDGI